MLKFSQEGDFSQGGVNVGLAATFYETMTGGTPDSGLPADTSASGTATADTAQ